MFDFLKKRRNQQKSTKNNSRSRDSQAAPNYSPVVRYALHKAEIDKLPDGAVGVIIADAGDILGIGIGRGIFKVPVIVHRTGDRYEFYNHEMVSCGDIQILGRDEANYDLEIHGKELQPYDGGPFIASKFMDVLAYDYAETDKLLRDKFPNARIFVCAEE